MKLIKFYTTWCGPCKTQSMMLKQIDLTGVELIEVDAEADQQLANQYNIQSVPVMILLKHDAEVVRFTGLTSPDVIEEAIGAIK
jgi:thioredoxin 1